MNFDPITYNEAHALREHFKLIYGDSAATAFVFDAGITAASLETWLGTPANLAAFQQLVSTYIGPSALISNTTTWTAVVGSSTAMAQVIASSTAMAQVAASSTAMAQVIASSTAMAQVIASSTAMAQVAASSTAMAQVAASSTAMAQVAASSTAMAQVAASSTALTQIFAGASAKAAFKGSTALTAAAIPTMTSNTAPSGTASASTIQSATYDAFKALDKTTAFWLSASSQVTNQWVKYQFPAAVYIHSATLKASVSQAGSPPKNIKVQFSDDGTAAWSDGASGVHTNDAVQRDYDVIAAGKHAHWRLFFADNYGGSYISVDEITLTGFTW